MKFLNLDRIGKKSVIAFALFCGAFMVYADATSYIFPSATFDSMQKRVLTTLLNTKMDKSGSSMTSTFTRTTNGTNPFMGTVTLVAGEKYLTNTALTAKSHIFAQAQTTSSVARIYATYQTNGGGRIAFQAYTNAVGGAAALAAGDTSTVIYQVIEGSP